MSKPSSVYGQTCPKGTDEKGRDRFQETTEQAKTLENTRATIETLKTHSTETLNPYLFQGSCGYSAGSTGNKKRLLICRSYPMSNLN